MDKDSTIGSSRSGRKSSITSYSKKSSRRQSTSSSIVSSVRSIRARVKQQNASTNREVDVIDPHSGEVRSVKALAEMNPRIARPRDRESTFTSGQVSPSSQSDYFSERFSMGFGSGSISRAESTYSGSSEYSFMSEDHFSFTGQLMSFDDTRSVTSARSDASISELDYEYHDPRSVGDGETEDEDEELAHQGDKNLEDDTDPYGGLGKDSYEQLMEREFSITLQETPTMFLFENYDRAVASDAPHLPEVREQNTRYLAMKNKIRENPDRYPSNSSQTLNRFSKNKYTYTESVEIENAAINVTGYEIYDEYEHMREIEEREREEREQMLLTSADASKDNEEEEGVTNDQMAALEDDEPETQQSTRTTTSGSDQLKKIIKKPYFTELLMTIERMLVQNKFKNDQLEYKRVESWNVIEQPLLDTRTETNGKEFDAEEDEHSIDDVDSVDNEDDDIIDTDDEDGAVEDGAASDNDGKNLVAPMGDFKTLWNFECSLTEGISTNCMAWNQDNEDILAAGYSNVGAFETESSLILCWTIKNPTYPERVIRVPNLAVTSLGFSQQHPSLLAAGFSDGTVNVYDVRRQDNEPVLESSIKHHSGTVWGLQWVQRGQDVGERLHSVGVDGRINSWSIKKGLDCQELMRLRRTSKRSDTGTSVSAASAALVSRETGGMCFDADPLNDHNQYIVGTEDGPIYRCSCSYNEQYLETYYGHTGPVYRVCWDPFDNNQFASCSADWTIRLWHKENSDPHKTIEIFSTDAKKQSSAVTDIAWSNTIPGIIGATSVTGHVDLWDVSNTGSTVRPRFRTTREGVIPNTMLFAKSSHAMLVGYNSGTIEVLKPNLD